MADKFENLELYDGPVVFGDGVHYPILEDGNADLDRPLRWVSGSTYRLAEPNEPKHNDIYHKQFVDMEVNPY